MANRLEGKVAIVTGAGSGIGRATAELFVKEGAKVVVTDINDEAGQKVADILGKNAFYIHLNVANEEEWQAVVAKTCSIYSKIDILVNNAGIAIPGAVTEMSFADWKRIMAINLDSVFLGTKYVVKVMKEQGHGGSVVNVSSIAGMTGLFESGAYCASKGGVRLFTKSVALECANWNIRVNSLHPGYVQTAIWDSVGRSDQVANCPMNRMAKPEEMANSILYLASDESSYMTGSELVVDGGYTAR